MGALVDSRTGAVIIDLPGAKFAIDLLGVVEEKTKGNLTPQESEELTQILAELRAQGQSALRTFLFEIAAKRPLLIAVDDFERFDPESRALVALLAHKATHHPLVLAVASDANARHDGDEARMLSQASIGLALAPLSLNETQALLASVQEVVLETHSVVLDIQNEVSNLARRFDLLHRELRPRDSLSINNEGERQLVKQLVARYRALPEGQRQQFPALEVAGTLSPPFRELTSDEREAVIVRINEAEPDYIWVGLGTPKQDLWLSENRARLNASALLAVGAAFDLLAGRRRRAPRWMQRTGTEWIFRLATAPRRLGTRYTLVSARFVGLLVRDLLCR